MKYVCPKHPDVILYEDNNAKENMKKMRPDSDRISKMYIPKLIPPKECPKCKKGYYQNECLAK